MKLPIVLFAWVLSLCAVAGCSAAPATADQTAAPIATPAPRSPAASGNAPPLDTRCRTDADCTVKNVGNCCGAFPACVNVASPADPAAVQAQCRASGRMSVCGFREISDCQCNNGQCTAKSSGADTLRRPIESTEPVR